MPSSRPEPELLDVTPCLPEPSPHLPRPLVRQPERSSLVIPRLHPLQPVVPESEEIQLREHERPKHVLDPHRQLREAQEPPLLDPPALQVRKEKTPSELKPEKRLVVIQSPRVKLLQSPPDVVSVQQSEPVLLPRVKREPDELLGPKLSWPPLLRPWPPEPLRPVKKTVEQRLDEQSPPLLEMREMPPERRLLLLPPVSPHTQELLEPPPTLPDQPQSPEQVMVVLPTT